MNPRSAGPPRSRRLGCEWDVIRPTQRQREQPSSCRAVHTSSGRRSGRADPLPSSSPKRGCPVLRIEATRHAAHPKMESLQRANHGIPDRPVLGLGDHIRAASRFRESRWTYVIARTVCGKSYFSFIRHRSLPGRRRRAARWPVAACSLTSSSQHKPRAAA